MIKANFFKFSVHFLKINFLKSRLRRSNFLASFSIFSRLNLTFEDHGTIFYLSQLHFLNFFNIRPLKFITRTLFIKYQGNHSPLPLKNQDQTPHPTLTPHHPPLNSLTPLIKNIYIFIL